MSEPKGPFDDAVYILWVEEQEEAAKVLKDWPKWEPLINAAGKVDKCSCWYKNCIQQRRRGSKCCDSCPFRALLESLPDGGKK